MAGNDIYEIFEVLGRNNCSVVHDGYDKESSGEVIILKLHTQFQSGGADVWADIEKAHNASLENTVERRALVKQNHWIVIQKLDGSLKEQLKSNGKLDVNLVRSVLRRVLQALCSYEENGIIHGCIKPGNLLFFDADYVRLNFSPGLRLGGQFATPCCDFRYLAPELIDEKSFGPIGPGVDLYALGFTALELLLGSQFAKSIPQVRELVKSSDDMGWSHWHTSHEIIVPPLAELLPGAPDDLIRVVDRLIKKNVSERYQSAKDALADLEKGPDVRISTGKGKTSPRIPEPPVRVSADLRKPIVQRSIEWIKNPKNRPIVFAGTGLIFLFLFLFVLSGGDPIVEFTTEPSGARLIIDNKTQFPLTTPVKLKLPAKKYKLAFDLEGFDPHEEEIEVKSEAVFVTHKFAIKRTKVRIDSIPPGATVISNGRSLGKTPLETDLKPGAFKFNLTLSKHERLNIVAEVAKTSPQELGPYTLVEIPEEMKPSGVEVDPDYLYPLWTVSEKYPDLRFAFVRPGEFSYGVTTVDGKNLYPGEISSRKKSVAAPYYIATTEVSVAQMNQFLKAQNMKLLEAPTDDLPAVGISLEQARLFCASVSPAGRLPTEVEWEYAAGDGVRSLPWETTSTELSEYCRFTFEKSQAPAPMSVFAHPNSATPKRGILNLLGNAAEWCDNIYEAGAEEQAGDPGVGVWNAIRGGGFAEFINYPAQVRITMRASCDPAGGKDVGVRVVIPLPAQ